jgi:flagellar basal-body rod modification protein FlgD
MTSTGNVAPPIGTVGANTGFSVGQDAGSSTTATGTSSDKDMFLKLLVAQMKYQDPSKPTDPAAFLGQTAQFTLVEKMEALAASQASMTQSSQLQSATSMVGDSVTYTVRDDKGVASDKTGTVTGVSISTAGVATLLIGDEAVPVSAVTKITKPSESTPS